MKDKKYLNIGSGEWRHKDVIGLDYEPGQTDVALDLNVADRLPFPDGYFRGIYSSHCLEHLKKSRVNHWVKECFRVLQPGGILRVTVPNIEAYFDAYESKNAAYFNWIRGKGIYQFDSWLRLIVRAFAEPVVDKYSDDELYRLYHDLPRNEFLDFFETQQEEIEDPRLLWSAIHKSWWSPNKFIALFQVSGFSEATVVSANETSCDIFRGKRFNKTHPEMSLFVEATKL